MILQKLKDTRNLSYHEKIIVEYILDNPDKIIEINAKDLALCTFISPSTIVRLCKKLGFKGYPHFQRKFIQEYYSLKADNDKELNLPFNNIPADIAKLYHNVVQETLIMIDENKLARIITLLKAAKKIDFYASDINYAIAQNMCINLNTNHIIAQSHNDINLAYVKSLRPEDCVSIIISHSGNNPSMVKIAYSLRKSNIFTIALTSNINHTLELICNESLYLYTPKEKVANIQRSLSLSFLLDVLLIELLKK